MSKNIVLKRVSMIIGIMAICLILVIVLPSIRSSALGPTAYLSLNKTELTLYTNQQEQLIPSTSSLSDVHWYSTNTNVVTVDSDGVVTAVGFGVATIRATFLDAYATCTCYVNPYMVNLDAPSFNQDARRVQFQFTTANDITMATMHIGSRTYYVNRPTPSNPFDQTISGDHVKVSVSYNPDTFNAIWDCQISLTPTVEGTTESIYFDLWNGTYTARSYTYTDYVFWDATIRTGISPGDYAYDYIGEEYLPDNVYYEIVDCISYQPITLNGSTKMSTGMILLRKYEYLNYDAIVGIEFVVVFGDVTGGTNTGDSVVDNADVSAISNYAQHTGGFPSYLFVLAADTNHSGGVTMDDVTLAQSEVNSSGSISQNYAITFIPPVLYYLTTVIFS